MRIRRPRVQNRFGSVSIRPMQRFATTVSGVTPALVTGTLVPRSPRPGQEDPSPVDEVAGVDPDFLRKWKRLRSGLPEKGKELPNPCNTLFFEVVLGFAPGQLLGVTFRVSDRSGPNLRLLRCQLCGSLTRSRR